jgi:cbb3-type cytochrome oxidase maturation protein
MAYYPFWALLIVLSLWASIGGFFWAYRNRQFDDQERARYLPLRGESTPSCGGAKLRGSGREAIAMLAVLALGTTGLLVTILVVILKNSGGGL